MVSENPILIIKAPILSDFCKTGFRRMSLMVDHRGGMLKSATHIPYRLHQRLAFDLSRGKELASVRLSAG